MDILPNSMIQRNIMSVMAAADSKFKQRFLHHR